MNWKCSCGAKNSDQVAYCEQCGTPNPQSPQPSQRPQAPHAVAPPPLPPLPPPSNILRSPRSSRISPLLLFFVLSGIGSALVLVGFMVFGGFITVEGLSFVHERSQQEKTMADIKAIAAACIAYHAKKGVYPQPPPSKDFFSDVAFVPALAPFLVPAYIAKLPESDPSQRTYRYGVSPDGKEFAIVSGQWSKKIDPREIPSQFVGTHCFDDDLIWKDDKFVQAPEGKQQPCTGQLVRPHRRWENGELRVPPSH